MSSWVGKRMEGKTQTAKGGDWGMELGSEGQHRISQDWH